MHLTSAPIIVDHTLTVSNVAIAAASEPAAWAMLLPGFGLTGAAVRRRPGAALAALRGVGGARGRGTAPIAGC